MVGNFSLISMALNDQVFALSNNGSDHIHFRSDVTPSELSGKEWKILNYRSITDSMSSLSSDSSHNDPKGSIGKFIYTEYSFSEVTL